MSRRIARTVRAVRSGSARARLAAAIDFLSGLGPTDEAIVVGASRGAVDDLVREFAARRTVSFGLHRFSVTQLAARIALVDLAASHRTAITGLSYEALATRATFDVVADRALRYLEPVRGTPGFPGALASTLTELRLNGVTPDQLDSVARSGPDLSDLLQRVGSLIDEVGGTDRAALFELATARLSESRDFADLPVVLVDVPFDSAIVTRFLSMVVSRASRALVTVPAGDLAAARSLASAGIAVEDRAESGDTDFVRLQTELFSEQPPPERTKTGELVWLSAPGEGRECVEIARRIVNEAAHGVRFDEMAVLLRSPGQYLGLIEQALDRAGVPAHFDRGTRRPDPSGRAFLALLACATENLSARRFAEYLSLAQVPIEDEESIQDDWVIPDDEGFGLVVPMDDLDSEDETAAAIAIDRRAVAAPWRWEHLIVDASVIGGRERWARRLNGLAEEFRARIRGVEDEDPDDPRIDRLTRELDDLAHLQAFALPLIQEMGSWPGAARWREWLTLLDPFVRRAIRRPDRVLQVLAGLHSLGEVGPVRLIEVRDVLTERLGSLDRPTPGPRYGKVFVAGIEEVRGRTFKVVFVPGLAERVFPRAIREDPLLLDGLRGSLDGLLQQEGRAALERLSLRLAVGAATTRVFVSFPRISGSDGRARVPSFYALELMRAVTGRVPDYRTLGDEAAETSNAALAWPAPVHAADAIDDFEHDLSVLRSLMSEPPATGRAQYMVQLNPHLRRSLTSLWNRTRSSWTMSDGIVRVTDALRPFLATQRLGARPYSVSALQHYAACPYRFLLSAIYRLAPTEEPAPLQHMDPLTRGSLFHRVQADLFRALQRESRLPPSPADRDRIVVLLDRVIDDVAGEYAELLAPAIDRVWRDEIAAMTSDLHVWISEVLNDQTWEPWRFEFAFGLPDQTGRDEHSLADPVTLDGRFILRGSIDLVERKRGARTVRVTDYKTGANRSARDSVLGGGEMLQPVIYSLAVEAATGLPTERGRFWYCTSAGGFTEHSIPIGDRERRAGLEVLEIVDRAIELGAFPAAPRKDACGRCDFLRVCGPDEERRVRTKSRDLLGDLDHLREQP
jgi:RecB family exonuclease